MISFAAEMAQVHRKTNAWLDEMKWLMAEKAHWQYTMRTIKTQALHIKHFNCTQAIKSPVGNSKLSNLSHEFSNSTFY